MSALTGEHLTLTIDGRVLVKDVSLSANAGEILAIIGPNGAGKTSLVRALSGDWQPEAGQVMFNGRPLGDWPGRERAQALAVLTQANALSFGFTVAEVVGLGRTPHSTGAVVDHRVCRAAMKALDVVHLAERLYPSLSGGEQQRVQLARVMAQIWRPDSSAERVLLLDEPVTSLDLGHQQQLMQAVRAFADSGVAVVMVVHDISLAAAYSDYLIALKDGVGVACGPPEQVVTQAQISALFDTRVQVIAHPDTGKPVVLAGGLGS